MQFKEVAIGDKILKYRSPNIPDTLKLLGRVRKKVAKSVEELTEEEWLSYTIESMDFLFDTSAMDCDYEGLLEVDEAAEVLIEVATDFFIKMSGYIKKKAPLKTQSTPTPAPSRKKSSKRSSKTRDA